MPTIKVKGKTYPLGATVVDNTVPAPYNRSLIKDLTLPATANTPAPLVYDSGDKWNDGDTLTIPYDGLYLITVSGSSAQRTGDPKLGIAPTVNGVTHRFGIHRDNTNINSEPTFAFQIKLKQNDKLGMMVWADTAQILATLEVTVTNLIAFKVPEPEPLEGFPRAVGSYSLATASTTPGVSGTLVPTFVEGTPFAVTADGRIKIDKAGLYTFTVSQTQCNVARTRTAVTFNHYRGGTRINLAIPPANDYTDGNWCRSDATIQFNCNVGDEILFGAWVESASNFIVTGKLLVTREGAVSHYEPIETGDQFFGSIPDYANLGAAIALTTATEVEAPIDGFFYGVAQLNNTGAGSAYATWHVNGRGAGRFGTSGVIGLSEMDSVLHPIKKGDKIGINVAGATLQSCNVYFMPARTIVPQYIYPVADFAALPGVGNSNALYITLDDFTPYWYYPDDATYYALGGVSTPEVYEYSAVVEHPKNSLVVSGDAIYFTIQTAPAGTLITNTTYFRQLGGKIPTATNVSVLTTDWVANTVIETSALGYAFRAIIPITGVLESMQAIVSFNPGDACSGNFAPFVKTTNGYLTIYAITKPTADMTIPVVSFIATQ